MRTINYLSLFFFSLPVFCMGYLLSSQLFPAPTLSHLGIALLFSFLFYQVIFLLKGLFLVLKEQKVFLWAPLFLLCVVLTCLFAPYVAVAVLFKTFFGWSSGSWMTYLVTLALGALSYSKYQFLTP